MASIGWLHLTDLHFGLPGQKWLWPTVREQFYRDLGRLHAKSGPWDLVLFTGDLTQRGTKEEFDRLTETLGKLWDHLAKLGSKPALVTVPGNHDLQRPKVNPAVRALRGWHDHPDLREEFWGSADNEYRVVVSDAFVAYEDFVKNYPLPASFTVQRGELPGDCSISLERDGLKLALVGLNSAFLQLESGDYQGKLDLDVRQLHGVCGDDPPEWLGGHHATLLMTHHPTTWLHSRALASFKADIAPPGRFLAHLFGHMHEGSTTSLAVSGSSLQRAVQGPSLFGLETWGEGTEQRIHGYMAGRVTLEGRQGAFTLWPRELRKNRAGAWQMAPDFSFELHNEAIVEEFSLRKAAALAAAPPMVRRPEALVHAHIDVAESSAEATSAMQSTFISYGGPDEVFARKLYEGLYGNGVRAFFFPEHAEPGEKLHDMMRKGVNAHDRIVLLCSKSSLNHSGVLNEIEQTLAREARDGGASYLIPVRIDDYVFKGWAPPKAGMVQELKDRVIIDFSDPGKFDAALLRLIGVLKK